MPENINAEGTHLRGVKETAGSRESRYHFPESFSHVTEHSLRLRMDNLVNYSGPGKAGLSLALFFSEATAAERDTAWFQNT